MANGHQSDYKASQIQTLYFNGYKKEAWLLLEEAKSNTRNVYFLETLKEIEQSFTNESAHNTSLAK